MKLNGALKPRQGASKLGSSPGVVQRKYRDKRYCKLNENVIGDLPFYECYPTYKRRDQNIIKNSKNNKSNNKQPQQQQSLKQNQQQEKNQCDENSYNNSSLNSSNFYDSIYMNINKTTKYRNLAVTKTITQSFAFIDFNSNGNSDKIQQIKAATATPVSLTAVSIIDAKQKNKNDITTRQVKNWKRNNNYINKNNNNNYNIITIRENGNNTNESKTQQVKEIQVVRTSSNSSKHHITVNKTHKNQRAYNNNNINRGITYDKEEEVNKFLLIPKIYEYLILYALTFWAIIISQFLIQLKLLLSFMCLQSKKQLAGYPIDRSGCGDIGDTSSFVASLSCIGFKRFDHNFTKIMRASQSLKQPFGNIYFKNVNKPRLPLSIALWIVVFTAAAILLPQPVVGDNGDTFFPINGIETTTPEFDYASRGQKKFGDKCENTLECGFPGSICDPKKKSCQCTEDLPVTNHIDKCGKEAAVNESCFFNEQCEMKYFQTECRDQRCVCRFDMTPVWLKDGTVECKGRGDKKGPERYIDPAMIGVLIGMALMFIIICVVLRLFSQARWRENRTIFNTPNPRLMNVSLLRESKLLHGQERRGSRMSVRAPSRQPSMASLRPHSPNPSLGSRSNSHGSNASATSLRSTRSNSVSPAGIAVNNTYHERKGSTYQTHHHPSQPTTQQLQLQQQEQQPLRQTNIISNPVAETVTVEIIGPEK